MKGVSSDEPVSRTQTTSEATLPETTSSTASHVTRRRRRRDAAHHCRACPIICASLATLARVWDRGDRPRGPVIDEPMPVLARADRTQVDEEVLRLDARALLRHERDLEADVVRRRPVDPDDAGYRLADRVRDDWDLARLPLGQRETLLEARRSQAPRLLQVRPAHGADDPARGDVPRLLRQRHTGPELLHLLRRLVRHHDLGLLRGVPDAADVVDDQERHESGDEDKPRDPRQPEAPATGGQNCRGNAHRADRLDERRFDGVSAQTPVYSE